MCTAIRRGSFFGRTLDLEYSYFESVTVSPRRFSFPCLENEHFAIIGMATVAENYPLYYDALNEKGLCMAGLNFPKSAAYPPFCEGKKNIATYELIPFVLGQCETAVEARQLLENTHIFDGSFSKEYPKSPLHFMIADKERSLTLEITKGGTHIYENDINVLTNEPPFPKMLTHLSDFSALNPIEPSAPVFGRGEGALGLPGDWSSPSRFVRAAFAARHTKPLDESGFFRAIATVEVPKGCLMLPDGKPVFSIYTSCMDMEKGIYYYKTYDGGEIKAFSISDENLADDRLISYPIQKNKASL